MTKIITVDLFLLDEFILLVICSRCLVWSIVKRPLKWGYSNCAITEPQSSSFYFNVIFLGNLIPRHREIFYKNPLFVGMKLPEVKSIDPFADRMPPKCSKDVIDVMEVRWTLAKYRLKLNVLERLRSAILCCLLKNTKVSLFDWKPSFVIAFLWHKGRQLFNTVGTTEV